MKFYLLILGAVLPFWCHAQQYGKYTLYSVQNTSNTYLIDTNGTTVKTWTHAANARTGYSSYLMPGGVLWRTVINQSNSLMGGGMTGRVQKVAFDGTILWDYTHSSSNYCLHHDICPMPNGNVLLISYEVRTAAELAQAGGNQNIAIWSEKIMEVQPTGTTTGTVVWEWKVWDHLVQNVNPAKDNYQTSIVAHPELLNINFQLKKDWIHMNGIDYNPMLDQIALSSHNLNEWYIIDHSTTTAEAASHSGGNSGKGGDILYRYGNPAAYGASGSTVLNVTHDAHWIPEGVPNAGRLVGFNNKGVSSTKSAVDQIVTPVSGYNYAHVAGAAYQPAIYDQRHPCNGYSSNMANSQQLPNGNMLVCIATAGLMYEISPAGTLLWSKTATGNVPQAFRYNECYVSTEAPAIPEISLNALVLTSTQATTYQWYKNGQKIEGATSQTYTVAETGIYLVRTTDAGGCEAVHSYSKGLKVTMPEPLSVAASASLSTVCAGEPVGLSALATGGTTNTAYNWSSVPVGFSASVASPTANPLVSTLYKVLVTNGSESDSAFISIAVNPLPDTPQITQNANELTATLASSYAWYWNGMVQPTFTTQTISPTQDGQYQVGITDANGCKSSLSPAFDFTLTSTDGQVLSGRLSAFPNPAEGKVTLRLPFSESGFFRISLYDKHGKQVYSTQNQSVIDVSHLPSGLYRLTALSVHGSWAHTSISISH